MEEENNDKMYLMTNFSIQEFLELYYSIEDILAPKSHRDAMLTAKTKFLLTHCWCKHAETFKFLAENYNITFTYAHNVIIFSNDLSKWKDLRASASHERLAVIIRKP